MAKEKSKRRKNTDNALIKYFESNIEIENTIENTIKRATHYSSDFKTIYETIWYLFFNLESYLSCLELRNFKAFDEVKIKLTPLTILVGNNASGKSSIIHSLLLLKQSWESLDPAVPLVWEGRDIILPPFKELINKKSSKKELYFKLIFTRKGKNNKENKNNCEQLGVEFTVRQIRGRGLSVDRKTFSLYKNDKKISLNEKTFRQLFRPDRFLFKPTDPKIILKKGRVAEFANVLEQIKKVINDTFERIYHVYPLREPIRRETYYSKEQLSFPGKRGERILEYLKSNPQVYTKLKAWMEKNLCNTFNIKTKSGKIYLEIDGINAADTGFGYSQILPVLATILGTPQNSLILLEQPEIHLNPSLIVKLADFCCDVALSSQKFLLIETHSDHFIWRIRRRIAEDTEENLWKNTAIYFVERNPGESFSTMKQVEITKFGEIEDAPWPKDFLAPDVADAFNLLQAKLKRLKAQEPKDGNSN